MIELLYLASQLQCGSNSALLNIKVDIYQNQQLIKTMLKNDRVLLPVDSVGELTFRYSIVNNTTQCNLATPTQQVLSPKDNLPSMAGIYQQDSVQTLLNGLDDYEELFLVELGTTNQQSAAFDLQDVVIKVDNNPTVSSLYAD